MEVLVEEELLDLLVYFLEGLQQEVFEHADGSWCGEVHVGVVGELVEDELEGEVDLDYLEGTDLDEVVDDVGVGGEEVASQAGDPLHRPEQRLQQVDAEEDELEVDELERIILDSVPALVVERGRKASSVESEADGPDLVVELFGVDESADEDGVGLEEGLVDPRIVGCEGKVDLGHHLVMPARVDEEEVED